MPAPQDATLLELCLKKVIKTYLKVYIIDDPPHMIRKTYCTICHPEISTFLSGIFPNFDCAMLKTYENQLDHYFSTGKRVFAKRCHFLDHQTALRFSIAIFNCIEYINSKKIDYIRIWRIHQEKPNNVIYANRGWEKKSFSDNNDEGQVSFYTKEDADRYFEANYTT